MTRNATVLNYKESLLKESDVDLLRGPYWLNDTIISFYFEYLQNEVFSDNSTMLFVSAEVTQCIKMFPQKELGTFLDPLARIVRREFVFFALNDNEVIDSSGGSHWSLLLLSVPEKMVFHYDSSGGTNELQAVDVAEKILRYFCLPIQGKFENVSCLQQNNGHDCGVHVLCNAEQLAGYASYYGRVRGCPKLQVEAVRKKR